MMYYFTYGSNMDQEQMRERCKHAVLLGKAVLKGYRLAFTIFSPVRKCGCADIIEDSNHCVYGLLYRLTPADMKKLDVFEGHPVHYKRCNIVVINKARKRIKAEVYAVVHKSKEHLKPSKEYLQKIADAAKKFNFPKKYQRYVAEIETIV